MAEHYPISDLVLDARVLETLDRTPPPMQFHDDFGIEQTPDMQMNSPSSPSIGADFSFLSKGPVI